MSQAASVFHSSKFARLFVTVGSATFELPLISATINPGKADRIRFRHSMSQGGTDVDTGMKDEPTCEFMIEKDFGNDPFGTGLVLRGGTVLAKLDVYEYDPAAGSTPAGIKHEYVNFQLEDTVTTLQVEGKLALRFNGCCSTRNYTYTPAA